MSHPTRLPLGSTSSIGSKESLADSTADKGSKKRRLNHATNSAIAVAKITKDASEAVPILSPLKASMGILITLLETVKDVRKCEEDWIALSNYLADRIGILHEQITDKHPDPELRELVLDYKEALEGIVKGIQPLARKHKTWYQTLISAKDDADQINGAIRDMEEASNKFLTRLQLETRMGVAQIQINQNAIHEKLKTHWNEHKQRDIGIQENIHQLDNRIESVQYNQEEAKARLTEAEEILLLKGLTTAYLANGDIHELCMEGTRLFVLDKIRSWVIDEDSPQICWLADVAGSGKSTVANHLAREWKHRKQLAGRFFFSRAAEESRTSKYFFSTLAQQGLSHLGPEMQTAIVNGIRDLRDPVSASLDDQCAKLFIRPLTFISTAVILVLDALDECEPDTFVRLFRVLLPLLPNIPHLKLFLTSRPEAHIVESLQNVQVCRLSLRGNPEAKKDDAWKSNQEDLWQFITEKLKSISLQESQIEQLVKRSEGLFIWASTVCKLLQKFRGDRDQFVKTVLIQGPHQMDSIYRVALQQALPANDEIENLEVYKKVLGVIVVAFEPLSPKTIDIMLKIQNTFEIVQDLASVLDCHHPDDPIQFLHTTFRDFLLKLTDQNPYHIEEANSHTFMAETCLDTMARNLRWDICDLFHRFIDKKKYESYEKDWEEQCRLRLQECTTHALRYSCRFWQPHLSLSNSPEAPLTDNTLSHLDRFFRQNLLDWIYLASFMPVMNEPWILLRKAVAGRGNDQLTGWANDADQFLKRHYRKIQSNPLDVYRLFAFTPQSTIFQTIYARSQAFPHPVVTSGLPKDWPSHSLIQSHIIRTQCLSPCSDWLATGGYQGSQPVYGLWNVGMVDGETYIHPCATPDCLVLRTSFYEDNTMLRLQTFCECGLLCCWNPQASPPTLLGGLQLESDKDYEWWSDDGSKAVARQRKSDGNFSYYLWKRDMQPVYHKLQPYTWLYYWVFSPGSGDRLMYREGSKVEMWDCVQVHHLFTKRFNRAVHDVQFTPDSQFVLVCIYADSIHYISSNDATTIWHVPVKVYYDGFPTYAFPSGGRRIIIFPYQARDAGNNDRVMIVDAANGSTIAGPQKLQNVHTVFLNPMDDLELLVMDNDRISSWRPQDDGNIQELGKCRLEFGCSMCISWKHSTLMEIMGSTISFSPLHLVRSPPSQYEIPIDRLLLSPDGQYLATVTEHGHIQISATHSGGQLMSCNIAPNNKRGNLIVEFTEDPSTLMVCGSGLFKLINVKTSSIKSFEELETRYFFTPIYSHLSS
ncbi:hypothetical protein CPB86DRAFT_222868, partial [Serendipita vermifera]